MRILSPALAAAVLSGACGRGAGALPADAGPAPGSACDGGSCAPACGEGRGTLCEGRCLDLSSDHDACGQCSNACDVDAVCLQGVCTASCPEPLTACQGHCVDAKDDPHHCGGCGNDCGRSHLCGAGGVCAAYCPLAAASAIGPGNSGAAVGDVDGNGTLDVVAIVNQNSASTLAVYLGGGDGTFQALATQPLEPEATSVALADLDGDHRLDAAFLTGSGVRSMSIYLGQGGGLFAPAGSVSAGVWSRDLALEDLDGDGAKDAVIANNGGSQTDGSIAGNDVTALFNDGHASFGRALHLQAGLGPSGVAIVDLDGDGAPDIAATDVGTADPGVALNLFYGDGHGRFAAAQSIALPTNGSLAVADLLGKGRADVAVLGWDSVLVLLNQGGRTFAHSVSYPAPFGGTLAIGDMNRDGMADLVVGGGGLAVLFNRGDGTFESAAVCAYPNGGSSFAAGSPRIAILRADGRADVVTADDSANGDVSIWWGEPLP